MGPAFPGTLINLASFAFAVVIVIVVCRFRKLPLRETLALRWPGRGQTLLWMGLFALLAALEEYASRRPGLDQGKPWTYAAPMALLRATGIILFAPVTEELIFRGLLFDRILHTRLGPVGAVLLPAVLFAAAHVQYGVPERAQVFADGLFLGLVRYKSGSLLLPLLLHGLGNAYAVYQRLT